jgi:hypothetical protein
MAIRFSLICVYLVDSVSVIGDGACKKRWCIESKILMPLATDKCSGNVFQYMTLEELMVGEDFELASTYYKFAGANFTIRKMKFR